MIDGDKAKTCEHGNLGYCVLCRAQNAPKCKHGNPWVCGLCEAEKAPKCKHGNPWYCGLCGVVDSVKRNNFEEAMVIAMRRFLDG